MAAGTDGKNVTETGIEISWGKNMKKWFVPICYAVTSVLSFYLAFRNDSVLGLVAGIVWLAGAIIHFKKQKARNDNPEE
jgi:hypothetical protein